MNSVPKFKRVLAIETSCDDTSIALVRYDGFVEKVISANQDFAHRPFGGVVPEIAGRNHTLQILPLIDQVLNSNKIDLNDIDGIAVTNRPGLIGSLLVGVVTAKSLAMAVNKPFIGVNHLEGHLLAPFLKDDEYSPPENFIFPYLALAVSGGHTSLYQINAFADYQLLGCTIDDAAGEAFDKFAKIVGLGFPGGVRVDQFAKAGNVKAFRLPRGLYHEENFNFSFSGLKTAAQRLLDKMSLEERERSLADLSASFQEAIVEALLNKLDRAMKQTGIKRAIITGGVSANSRLRAKANEWAEKQGVLLIVPPIRYCTDNAAMIGFSGIQHLNLGQLDDQTMGPSPVPYETDFKN